VAYVHVLHNFRRAFWRKSLRKLSSTANNILICLEYCAGVPCIREYLYLKSNEYDTVTAADNINLRRVCLQS